MSTHLESVGRVVSVDAAAPLLNDGPLVDLRGDEVHGAAGAGVAGIQDGLVHVEVHAAGVQWQEGGVDVDDSIPPRLDEIGGEYPHVPDAEHELHAAGLHLPSHLPVEGLSASGFLSGHEERLDASGPPLVENAGL